MSAKQRAAERKNIDSINICDLTSLSNYQVIARLGSIVDASITGFLVLIQREDLVPKWLRSNLTLEELLGHQVVMYLPEMNLDLDGKIIRADHRGRGAFEVGIEFAADVPEYWRECLIDLLPYPGEMKETT